MRRGAAQCETCAGLSVVLLVRSGCAENCCRDYCTLLRALLRDRLRAFQKKQIVETSRNFLGFSFWCLFFRATFFSFGGCRFFRGFSFGSLVSFGGFFSFGGSSFFSGFLFLSSFYVVVGLNIVVFFVFFVFRFACEIVCLCVSLIVPRPRR